MDDNRHSSKKLNKWKKINGNSWKVVPDCPDLKNEFNIETNVNNIEYSKELILELFDPGNDNHLPVIQALYHSPESALDFAKWFKKEYPDYNNKFGLGTLCRSNNKQIVRLSCKYIRNVFPNAWLHGFGLRLHHIPDVANIINSYDSSAWTFPRGKGRGSAKNKKQRIQFFHEYLDSLDRYLDPQQTTLEGAFRHN
jgi:hypothetical protein